MPNWVAWLGWILTVVQFIGWIVEWARRGPRYEHLRATRDQVRALRSMCVEAIENGEVIKTEAERQWVRQLGFSLVAIETQIGAAMGGKSAAKP